MTTGRDYAEADETVGDRFIQFYAERAKGGTGLIIIPFTPVPIGAAVEPGLYDDRFILGIRKLTRRPPFPGAKSACQLIITYFMIFKGQSPEVVAPSAVMNQLLRLVPRELTKEEIALIVKAYAESAQRARAGGFDAIEILVGAGYLLNRFLSPISNQREDEYAGRSGKPYADHHGDYFRGKKVCRRRFSDRSTFECGRADAGWAHHQRV